MLGSWGSAKRELCHYEHVQRVTVMVDQNLLDPGSVVCVLDPVNCCDMHGGTARLNTHPPTVSNGTEACMEQMWLLTGMVSVTSIRHKLQSLKQLVTTSSHLG